MVVVVVVVVVVVMEGILDTMELMVIILPTKGKLQCTTRSGIIPRQNKMRSMRRNGYHIETMNDGNKECLYITSIVSGKKLVVETLSSFSTRLYHTTIKPIESYVVVNQ